MPCLFRGRTTAATAVDHILPHRGDMELAYDLNNLCSTCWSCHSRKTKKELATAAERVAGRVVICGLPGAGKTHHAQSLGVPYFDADEHCDTQSHPELVQVLRNEWLVEQPQDGRLACIVSHPTAACRVAQQHGANVYHATCDETERHRRLQGRRNPGGGGFMEPRGAVS
ncbi:MAG: HNH endonuclease [Planctomycetota bacterium]